MSSGQIGIEKRIIATAAVFVLSLTGVIALSVKLFGIDLPTCLDDVKPFAEGKVIEQAPKRYEIHYLSRMWKFEPAEVFVPPGSTADIYLATSDVTHGMQIVGTNVNLMAVPGAVNFARVKFDEPGDYLVVCNEYCGIAHHNMAGVIHVTENIPAPPPPPAPSVSPDALALFDKYECTACHSLDGSEGMAASLKGLFGTERTLADGTKVVADEAYIRESIADPSVKIVSGFDDMMVPSTIPEEDLKLMIETLKALR